MSDLPRTGSALLDAPRDAHRRPLPRFVVGAALALASAALVLAYLYWARPAMARDGTAIQMDEDTLSALKACIALGALTLSLFEGMRRLQGRPLRTRTVRWGFGVLAGLAALGYFGFGATGYIDFYHRWDVFHYYLGSKYAPELGYKGLYACTALAQAELGPEMRQEVLQRGIRDLRTDVVVSAQRVFLQPQACRSAFTPERWDAFKADVAWFRDVSGKAFFSEMQTDHGYNPPPVWTMLGHGVSLLVGPASDTTLKVLASIDIFFFAGMFLAIGWAFGARVLCVSLIFWGTQFAANAFFTSGSYSRQDWLFFLVLTPCLLRKHRPALAGASLALSSLLRLFPVLFALPIVLVAVAHAWRTKKLARTHLRFFAGLALGGVLLSGASIATLGFDTYREFADHIAHHNSAPLTNHMGLPTLFSVSAEGRMKVVPREGLDPFAKWRGLRKDYLAARRPAFLLLATLAVLAIAVAVWRVRALWVAMAFGAVLAMALLQLTNYYYSFLLVPCLLAAVSRPFERAAFAASAASALVLLWPKVSFHYDDRYVTQTLVFLPAMVGLLAAFWGQRVRNAPARQSAVGR